ncbi:DUF1571 domain-containing protein [Roseimaritima ulvae]|uniref:DUF1571 domain-containing protein n=1 Tax=Roseimaritima ulvae TaxID=980254 RepID=A0A5B9R0L5_9BACT|nr:DUF1571 domain-containing protein [Roseimaritima ulvae]QEG43770.1 hypothetical protein UC8_58250 [Roseimaritima ulvae]
MKMIRILLAASLTLAASSAQAQSDHAPDDAQTPKLASLSYVQPASFTPSNIRNNHPLEPLLSWAEQRQQRIREQVRDYTCVLVSRERVRGKLGPRVYIAAKVRHEQIEDGEVKVPFSLYLKFLAPQRYKDREVLYVEGRNDDKLLVRKGGRHLPSLTANLDPTCVLAMAENRYPITEFGILRLVDRLITLGKQETAYGECKVEIDDEFETEKRVCTQIEIQHPVPRDYFQYCLARIYVDNDLQLPIRFESYYWPEADDEDPLLLEEYTYHDLKLNVGLTDEDFDPNHPDYQFAESQ